MKKFLFIVLGILILSGIGGGGYYYYYYGRLDNNHDTRPPKDWTGIIQPPIKYSMKGKTFVLPESSGTKVTLDLLVPTTRYDYPMGKFTTAGTSSSQGTLEALDNFTTDYANNLQALPIVVNQGGTGEFYYLAILSGDNRDHIASLPIGDRISVQNVTRDGDKVSVNYLVHDRGQAMAEIPTVDTTAIFDIGTKLVLQAGRTPDTEEVIITKNFVGEYLWKNTKQEDGKVVTPYVPDVFNIIFSANRINVGTDCDVAGAEFVPPRASSSVLTFTNFTANKKVCHAEQDDIYFGMIQKITNYKESSDGTLTFSLSDKSTMTFEPKVKVLPTASSTASST